MPKLARVLLLALIVATTVPATPAQTSDTTADPDRSATQQSRVNVLLRFRIGSIEDGVRVVKKTYDIIVVDGGAGSKLLSGNRVPLPNPGDETDGDYVYQNIGFFTEVRAHVLDKNQVKIVANIEDSNVVEDVDGGPPTIQTRQLTVDAVLTDGTPLELTRVENVSAENSAGFVDVEARILGQD